jgi:radical SAM superfamily enzyme YgiQ (UPF0313 family)
MQVILLTDVTLPGYLKYAGPFRIASELRSNGFTVQVIDYATQWSTTELKNILRDYISDQTLWVGFTTTFNSPSISRINRMTKSVDVNKNIYVHYLGRNDIPEILDFIKTINPKTKIVAGGHQADKFSLEKMIDHVVIGQGETAAVHLTKSLLDNQKVEKYLNESKFPYNNFISSTIEYVPEDIIFPGEHLSIEFSRGCTFKCSFCNYPLIGRDLWDFCKPPTLIASEIQRNYDLFKTQGYLVTDDTINDSEEKIEQLHKEITKLPFSLTLSSYARLDLLIAKPRTLDLLYEMGFRNFFFGIETFNHDAGKAIGKGMHPDKLKAGLEDIKRRYPDFLISAGIIFGLPYESRDSMLNTIEYLKSSPIDNVSIAPYGVTRTSTIGSNPEKYQFKVNGNLDWTSAWTTSAEVIDLAKQADQILRPKNKANWTFLSRLMNLGYSYQYLGNTPLTDIIFDAEERKETLRIQYYKKIRKS